MPSSVALTFLGTGNFFAEAGYWNSFLLDGRVLVEVSPTVLPNLHRAGVDPTVIDVVFISHFHADHSFGWPFLLLSYLTTLRRASDLWVVGPPGVRSFLADMVRAGAIDHLVRLAWEKSGGFSLHFVEVTGKDQEAGGVRFRAVRVEHDPMLDCYGYLIERRGRLLGYSGDTQLCDGLRRLAADADALVLECSQRHSGPPGHMTLDDVHVLRREYPRLPLVLTHRGADVDGDGIPDVVVPRDLETLTL
jgi:ribonuclease BN (tRNA processing enzyme)